LTRLDDSWYIGASEQVRILPHPQALPVGDKLDCPPSVGAEHCRATLRGQAAPNALRRLAESAVRTYQKNGAGKLYGGRELGRGRVAAAMLRFHSHPEVYRRQEMKRATKSLVQLRASFVRV